jgi:transmembrane sensor
MSSQPSAERYQELAEKWLNGTISSEEAKEYADWYNTGQDREVYVPAEFASNDKELRDRILAKVLPPPIRMRRRMVQWAAAAAVIMAGGAGYLFFSHKVTPSQAVAVLQHDKAAPATNRATVTLATGRKVYLDSLGKGTLVSQGSVDLVKLGDGKIAYSGPYSGQGENTATNILDNPRGSKVVDVTLADGSRVWLNAGSRLVYPVTFTGNERSVEVDGEAYFEVAKQAGKPFVVKKGDKSIQVLGTHFNVKAYDDEAAMTVTLLEGSVKVQGVLLKPNEAAEVAGAYVQVVHAANVEAAVAWRNGYFDFNSLDIGDVMRQLGRWYDMDIVFEGNRPEGHYSAMLSRDLTASAVLKGLAYEGLHFRIEGNKVIITQ